MITPGLIEAQRLFNERHSKNLELREYLWRCISMCHLHGMISDAEFQKAKKRYIKTFG